MVLKLGVILDNYYIFKFRVFNCGKGLIKLIIMVCVIYVKFIEMMLFIMLYGVYY